jgi:hypothetical protein
LKHRYGIKCLPAQSWEADRSENNVLLAIFLACWRWLTSPLQAAASSLAAIPLNRPAPAAVRAVRPRFTLLATIHVPWLRLLS